MNELSVAEIISGLRGRCPWGVRLGHGSFLTMEFGERREGDLHGATHHGEWHLWFYMCSWRIEAAGKVLVGSDDDREKMLKTLDGFEFGGVKDIRVALPSLDLAIQFDSGTEILTFSSSESGPDQWWLFTPDGNCLTVHGGGRFRYGSSSEPGA